MKYAESEKNSKLIYDEEKIPSWIKERNKKKRFILVKIASSFVGYGAGIAFFILGIFVKEVVVFCFSIGFFLMATYVFLMSWMAYSYRRYLKVYDDKIILPYKWDRTRGSVKIDSIKRVYPNNNSPLYYITIQTKGTDSKWSGEDFYIEKEEIYSPEKFIQVLKELGVKVVDDKDMKHKKAW